ncbi:MAG: hypothetical protein PVJ57_10670 [Phycisphaerae bacterium]|jgi:hypothetical protein
MTVDLQPWAKPLKAFSDWIDAVNQTAGKHWLRRLKSNQSEQVESAVAEAVVWDFIGRRCDSTFLNESPGTGGIDFGFVIDGYSFFVEVTNISTKAASTASAMPDRDPFAGHYGLLTKNIRQKIRGKLKQARCRSDRPLLVAVTTLHWNASHACINRMAVEFAMGSPPKITGKFNPNTGEVEGDLYQSTDLSQSVFLSPRPVNGPDGLPIAQARHQPISGFLVGSFGLSPRSVCVLGALNPEASRPFNPAMLPDIPFCSFREWPVTTEMGFNWTISEADERERQQQAAEQRLRAAGYGEVLDAIRKEIVRQSGSYAD